MIQSVSKKLEMAILSGDLKPRERLVELELSSRLNASRFLVRKAIHELARKGLIELFPNKGARVVDPSREEVEDIFLVRLNLELLSAQLMVKKMNPGKLEKIKAAQREYRDVVRQGALEEMISKNEQFHHTLYETTANKFLHELLDKVRNVTYFFRYNAYFLPGRPQKSVADHENIIHALEERNLPRLKSLIEKSVLFPMNIYFLKEGNSRAPEKLQKKTGKKQNSKSKST